MKKFIAVVTSMAMAASLLTACGSNAASTETTTAAASEAASEKETAGKEAENTEAAAKTDGAASAQFQSSILFCGSTSLYPILSSLASSFTEKYVTWDAVDSSFPDSNISVYVAPGGSGVGVSAAIDGTADFGMLARDIKDSEIEALGEHYQDFVVAKDALTVSVNAENPICGIMDDMPVETIRQILQARLLPGTRWTPRCRLRPSMSISVIYPAALMKCSRRVLWVTAR